MRTKALRIFIALFFPHIAVLMQRRVIKNMKHHIDTSDGLWCIDADPKDVSKQWIEQNAFRLWFGIKQQLEKEIQDENI